MVPMRAGTVVEALHEPSGYPCREFARPAGTDAPCRFHDFMKIHGKFIFGPIWSYLVVFGPIELGIWQGHPGHPAGTKKYFWPDLVTFGYIWRNRGGLKA